MDRWHFRHEPIIFWNMRLRQVPTVCSSQACLPGSAPDLTTEMASRVVLEPRLVLSRRPVSSKRLQLYPLYGAIGLSSRNTGTHACMPPIAPPADPGPGNISLDFGGTRDPQKASLPLVLCILTYAKTTLLLAITPTSAAPKQHRVSLFCCRTTTLVNHPGKQDKGHRASVPPLPSCPIAITITLLSTATHDFQGPFACVAADLSLPSLPFANSPSPLVLPPTPQPPVTPSVWSSSQYPPVPRPLNLVASSPRSEGVPGSPPLPSRLGLINCAASPPPPTLLPTEASVKSTSRLAWSPPPWPAFSQPSSLTALSAAPGVSPVTCSYPVASVAVELIEKELRVVLSTLAVSAPDCYPKL